MRDSNASWQKILAQGFTSSDELLEFLALPKSLGSVNAQIQFKTRVPRSFANRMEKSNPSDPLLLQVLAQPIELQHAEMYSNDPLHEADVNPVAGLMHKYHGRVLLTLTGACAIHCRYCFRRHFPYDNNNPGKSAFQDVLAYIQKDKNIHEVILSGGDPLLFPDQKIAELLDNLASIAHINIVRFHTRIPVVLPERITPDLLQIFSQTRLHVVVVLHTNHPNEIDEHVANTCRDLRKIGCHLLNQSVLLAGINNDVEILTQLSLRLFECGILPYYLHVLDKVQGAAHFDIPFPEASDLFGALQTRLPGYLVPRLAREEAGRQSKTLLGLNI